MQFTKIKIETQAKPTSENLADSTVHIPTLNPAPLAALPCPRRELSRCSPLTSYHHENIQAFLQPSQSRLSLSTIHTPISFPHCSSQNPSLTRALSSWQFLQFKSAPHRSCFLLSEFLDFLIWVNPIFSKFPIFADYLLTQASMSRTRSAIFHCAFPCVRIFLAVRSFGFR